MAIKHKITINVRDGDVLKAGQKGLPERLLRLLFGDFTQIHLLTPGQAVDSVNIREVAEGVDSNGADETSFRRASFVIRYVAHHSEQWTHF